MSEPIYKKQGETHLVIETASEVQQEVVSMDTILKNKADILKEKERIEASLAAIELQESEAIKLGLKTSEELAEESEVEE